MPRAKNAGGLWKRLPLGPPEAAQLRRPLTAAQRNPFQTSDLQKCQMIRPCRMKPWSLWQFDAQHEEPYAPAQALACFAHMIHQPHGGGGGGLWP